MTTEGLKATRCLSEEGIRVNVTLIFQPAQGLLAAKAGASYLSPFVGRLDDVGEDGMAMVATLVEMLDTTTTRPRCWSRACDRRTTSSKRRAWAPTSPRARSRCSSSSSSTR